MASLRDMAVYSWEGMTPLQKAAVAGIPLVLALILAAGWIRSASLYFEVRRYEREANAAKRDAKKYLEQAAAIGREKLEAERRLAELEAKRDAKITEAEAANLKTLDARAEHERAVRERRTDDPSTEQLCNELAALGYHCS